MVKVMLVFGTPSEFLKYNIPFLLLEQFNMTLRILKDPRKNFWLGAFVLTSVLWSVPALTSLQPAWAQSAAPVRTLPDFTDRPFGGQYSHPRQGSGQARCWQWTE
jgi:hypothetical protein